MDVNQIVYDSNTLHRVFTNIANSVTGEGTLRDKTRYGEIKYNRCLSEYELVNLYRNSGIIRRLVDTYPVESSDDWMAISQVNEGGVPDIDLSAIEQYFSNLKMKIGKISLVTAFEEASTIGRKHGDGYIIIGFADGLEPWEPVDVNRLQSIEWLKVLDKYYCCPDFSRIMSNRYQGETEETELMKYGRNRQAIFQYDQRPDYYQVNINGVLEYYHCSRVLRFPGNKLVDNSSLSQTGGDNDSIVQTFYTAWYNWQSGLNAGAGMLSDYSQGVYKMKGLAQLLLSDLQRGTTENEERVMRRLRVADMGRSIYKSTLVDADEEDFSYTNRSYSGADQIMSNHEQALIASVDTPSYILLNTTNATGNSLSTNQTAGLAQRYDWVKHKNKWMKNNWQENYERMLYYASFIRELGINREIMYRVEPNAQVVLTPLEQLQVQELAADRDTKNIANGTYTLLTAQSQYLKPKWTPRIEIVEEDIVNPADVE